MNFYYWFKYWMRDVAVFRGEFGTPLGFTNEIGWITLAAVHYGIEITLFGILYFVFFAFLFMGIAGRFFRKKKIPEMNNTLLNEMNSEMQIILKDLKEIKEKLK